MQLTTPRLTLTPICEDDWPFFLQIRSDEQLMKYQSEPDTEEQIRARFERRLNVWLSSSPTDFIVREASTSQAVGNVGFRPDEHDTSEVEVGYTFTQCSQGKGYAHEALTALIDFAFRHNAIISMRAAVLAGNNSSSKLLEKNGFKHITTHPDACLLHGIYHDDHIYRLRKC